jgi:hypothetical protein
MPSNIIWDQTTPPTALDINQLRLIVVLSCQHPRPSVSCGSEFFLVRHSSTG